MTNDQFSSRRIKYLQCLIVFVHKTFGQLMISLAGEGSSKKNSQWAWLVKHIFSVNTYFTCVWDVGFFPICWSQGEQHWECSGQHFLCRAQLFWKSTWVWAETRWQWHQGHRGKQEGICQVSHSLSCIPSHFFPLSPLSFACPPPSHPPKLPPLPFPITCSLTLMSLHPHPTPTSFCYTW